MPAIAAVAVIRSRLISVHISGKQSICLNDHVPIIQEAYSASSLQAASIGLLQIQVPPLCDNTDAFIMGKHSHYFPPTLKLTLTAMM